MTNPPEETSLVPVKNYTEEDKRKALQQAVYYQQPFYGSFLQELTIKYESQLPAIAGITYNLKRSQYEIYINPGMFLALTQEERVAVLHHEVLHFTNKHLFRLPFLESSVSNEEKKLYNIGGDMAINQFIQGLPKGCVDVKNWKLDDGSLFPTFKSMEDYYELIKNESKKQQQSEDKKKEGKGPGTKGNVNEHLAGYKEFDQHMWDSLDEETKKQMLDEAKKILKRTVDKSSFSHSNIPDSIKDLLQEIEMLAAGINYKQILKNTIKRTVSCSDRENTWTRASRRYGAFSPGSRSANLPQLSFYADTSGSISVKELNLFLGVMCEFLKAGSRTCWLGLWHTTLYYKKKYKLHAEIDKSAVQSGGTTVSSALEDVRLTRPNLSIIFTDGYFEHSDVKFTGELVWIISDGGNVDHPMKHVGKTIKIENLR